MDRLFVVFSLLTRIYNFRAGQSASGADSLIVNGYAVQHSGQMCAFEGKNCQCFGSFTISHPGCIPKGRADLARTYHRGRIGKMCPLDQFQAVGGFTSFDAVVDVEFTVEVFDMAFDGVDGDDEFFGDFGVAAPGNEKGEYTLFLRGEWFKQRAVRTAGWKRERVSEGVENALDIGAQRFLCEGGQEFA